MVLSLMIIANMGTALFALSQGQVDRAYEFFCIGNALVESLPFVEWMECSDV